MRIASLALIAALASACVCRPRIVQTPSPPHDIVGVLADPETGAVGHVVVTTSAGGSVELATRNAATRIGIGQPPSAPFTFSDAQIQQLFGDALAAQPPPAQYFLLYFQSGSNQLTPESEKLVVDVLTFVKNRPAPDVSIVGHTDTRGLPQANIQLGRERAALIRDRLVAAGLDASLVSVASHGEADLLVPTADNTPEPKNRRVEISVR